MTNAEKFDAMVAMVRAIALDEAGKLTKGYHEPTADAAISAVRAAFDIEDTPPEEPAIGEPDGTEPAL
jgi:hypothetical protein